MTRIYAIVCAAIFTLTAYSQSNLGQVGRTNAIEKCAADLKHEQLLQSDPDYRARIEANERIVQNIIRNQASRAGGIYTIPVVVHVVHLNEPVGTGSNISDAQIQSGVTSLTDHFRNNIGNGVDTEIEFCLAQRDPNCAATTGIVRVSGTGVTDYSAEGIDANGLDGLGADEVAVKNLSRWPNQEYYNIWLVSEIDDNGGGAGIQGYAYYPGASSPVDGAVILHNAFGYDPTGALGYNLKSYTNENEVTVHELGHGLDLYHTFEGDNGGASCPPGGCGSGNGDCVGDTPEHRRSASNCPTGPNPCDVGNLEDVVHNYMDYSSETCQDEFTTGQKTRMRAALEGLRSGLINSLACTAPGTPPIAASCTPACPGGFGMGVYNTTFDNINFSSSSTVNDGGYYDVSCTQATGNLTPGNSYPISVNTGTSNNEDVRVYIDYNNNGDLTEVGELVFSSDNNTSHSGTVVTPAGATTGAYLRMRVVSDWFSNNITGACYSPQYGQIEDYAVYFQSGAPPPVANFSVNKTTACTGETVAFTDLSTNTPTAWAWDIDNNGSTDYTSQNPTHAYASPGVYTVKLTATNAAGSDDTIRATLITVNASPTSSTSTTNESCIPGGDGTATVTPSGGAGGYNYLWDPSAGSQTDSTATALAQGTYNVTVTDALGCTVTDNETVTKTSCVPATKVIDAHCPRTFTSLTDWVKCDAAGSSLTYQWRFINGADTILYTRIYGVQSSAVWLNLGWVQCLKYGLTYSVQVRAQIGVDWGNWGATCMLTMPAAMPTTQVSAAYCPFSSTDFNDWIKCDPVEDFLSYQWRFINGNDTLLYTRTYGVQASAVWLKLVWMPNIQFGKTYDVQVRAGNCTDWGAWGAVCQVTTAANVPATKVRASQCPYVASTLSDWIACDPSGTSLTYQWRFINGTDTLLYTRTYGVQASAIWLNLAWVNCLKYGVVYNVQVRAQTNGQWGLWGAVCTLTTPGAMPTTQVSAAYCPFFAASLNDWVSCNPVEDFLSYQWRFINGLDTLLYTRTYGVQASAVLLQLKWITNIQFGKTYDVQVRAGNCTDWGAWGPVCQITTPASKWDMEDEPLAIEPQGTETGEISLLVYPNPSDGNLINISLDGLNNKANEVIINVYDMFGRRVFSSQLFNSRNRVVQTITPDKRFAKGIYIIDVIANGNNVRKKVIVE